MGIVGNKLVLAYSARAKAEEIELTRGDGEGLRELAGRGKVGLGRILDWRITDEPLLGHYRYI